MAVKVHQQKDRVRFEANNDNTNTNGEKWFGAIQKKLNCCYPFDDIAISSKIEQYVTAAKVALLFRVIPEIIS